ncbi:7075_t:CDS:10 [Diversispora eburnea]|uniref:allantoinase n=1 Tax=Diversispora eburnea TaxID=1213867 RepID=A0A9N8YJH5_9GLOM|nr:7075_t:CDS:10 [Diversispora eburnea]
MSRNIKLVLTSSRILTPTSIDPRPGTIEIDNDGHIVSILQNKSSFESYNFLDKSQFLDVGENVIMSGVIDIHVHLNEPGRTHWEGFETGTKAAAAGKHLNSFLIFLIILIEFLIEFLILFLIGGVTTVIDMPLNSIPPTTTVKNLEHKIESAKGKCWVDVGFYGGIIPGNQNDLIPLIDSGVKGFKCFLIESGVDEFPCVNEQQVRLAYEKLQGKNSVFMFHAEMEDSQKEITSENKYSDDIQSNLFAKFLNSRPSSLELNAISLIIRIAKEFPTVRSHIVHLSTAQAIDIICKAKLEGIPLTVETCFHYLCLNAEEVQLGRTDFKCCPPIRDESNREELWKARFALLDGTIDYVVSDHSPCTADLKFLDKKTEDRDFLKAWGGISSLQFGLPVLWTEARKRGCGFHHLTTWLSKNTSKQIKLNNRKGEIKVGYDADFVIWAPEETFTVLTDIIQFKNKVTPYEGKVLYGVIKKTIVRGNIVYDVENGVVDKPKGIMPPLKILERLTLVLGGVTLGYFAFYHNLKRKSPLLPVIPETPALPVPYGYPGPINDPFKRHAYQTSFNRRLRHPDWVFEHLTEESLKRGPDVDRSKSYFKEDMNIPEMFRSKLRDYVKSGFDRGHLAPAADAKFSQEALDETFLLTNIAPQVDWAFFEEFCRRLVTGEKFSDVYIFTGTAYLPKKEADGKFYVKYQLIGDPPNTAVPTHFYKIVLATKKDKNSPDGISYSLESFLMPNQRIPYNDSLEKYIVPLDAIERTTGLMFFNDLKNKTVTSLCKTVKCIPIPPAKHIDESSRKDERKALPLPKEEIKALPLQKH